MWWSKYKSVGLGRFANVLGNELQGCDGWGWKRAGSVSEPPNAAPANPGPRGRSTLWAGHRVQRDQTWSRGGLCWGAGRSMRVAALVFLKYLLLTGVRTRAVHWGWFSLSCLLARVPSGSICKGRKCCVLCRGHWVCIFSSRSLKLSSVMHQTDKNKLILTAVCSKPLPASRKHCEKQHSHTDCKP